MSEYPGMQYNRRNTILPLPPFPPPLACQRYSTADEVEDAGEDISAAGGDDDDALCNSLSLPARFAFFALKLSVISSGT